MKVRQVLTSSIFSLLVAAGAAQGATSTWTNPTTGFWKDATNWTGGVPVAGSDVVIGQPTTVYYVNPTNPQLNSVTIDSVGGSTLVQDQDGLTTTRLTIGNTGIGTYKLSGGTLAVTGTTSLNQLILGAGNGGSGTFLMSGGTLTTAGIDVGAGSSTPTAAIGSGVFTQSGGTVIATSGPGEIIIGDTTGSSGSYTISSGSLTANKLFVALRGTNGTGRSFTQSGGTVTINTDITLGGVLGGGGLASTAGSYTLSGDSSSVLNAGNEYIGISGVGVFNQEGGVNNLALGASGSDRSLLIATQSTGSVGTYNMKNGALNAEYIQIGDSANGGQGTVNHSGGTVTVSQQLYIDKNTTAGTQGNYFMTGGTLNASSSIADAIYNGGLLQQSAGVIKADASGGFNGFRNDGTFTMSGGTLTGNGPKVNYGSFTGFGTVSGTGALSNQGTMKFQNGTSTISAPVTNTAGHTLEVAAVSVFNGSVTNLGTFKTTGTRVIFNGTYSEGGTFVSDPSTNTFDNGYGVLGTGALMGSTGDVFQFGLSVTMQSVQSSVWDTKLALMQFYKGATNATGAHDLLYAASDLGRSYAGYTNNFAWGTVVVESGNALTNTSGALYTSVLTLKDGISQVQTFSGNLKLYYDPAKPENSYLNNQTIPFGSGTGFVAPVPEPSAALLTGLGALGFCFRRRRA